MKNSIMTLKGQPTIQAWAVYEVNPAQANAVDISVSAGEGGRAFLAETFGIDPIYKSITTGPGAPVFVRAWPDDGYAFDKWAESGSTDSTVEIDSSTVTHRTALFKEAPEHTLNVQVVVESGRLTLRKTRKFGN